MSIISAGGAVVGAGGPSQYQIERSLRFNSADSAYLNRTAGTPTSNTAWAYSVWPKRGLISAGSNLYLIHAQNGGNTLSTEFFVATDNTIVFREYGPSAYTSYLQTTQVFRDPSAWYHIVLVYNAANATSGDRVRLYVNGTRVAAFSTATYPGSTSQATAWNTSGNVQKIGVSGTNTFNGYMTEINFIDGQGNLTSSDFGEYNTDTGVWQPKAYTGSYGTNGFYLNFSDNSGTTSTTLGKDYSGNGNNWTPNNFSVTAGAGNDSLVDTPTPYGTDTGVGGEVRGNYCTLNPLDKGGGVTLTNGNLDYSVSNGAVDSVRATMGISSGKWYWEGQKTSTDQEIFGIANASASTGTYLGGDVNGWGFGTSGNKYNNNTATSYGSSCSTTDIVGVAFDADNGTLTFYKNGVSLGTAFSGLTTGVTYFPAAGSNNSAGIVNFGQRPFAHTAPSGFKALCTQNLPEPTVVDGGEYFNTVLWTANETNRTIDVGFQPGLVWAKSRSNTWDHTLFDSVRGAGKSIKSNTAAAEATSSTSLTGFVSNGFTLGVNSDGPAINFATGQTFVGWNWKANGAGVSNTAGTISSTVSANTDSGFSIVTYTGNGTSGATVGHGLGAVPSMIIVKSRSLSTESWPVKHRSLASTKNLLLNSTTDAYTPGNGYIADLSSSTTFSLTTGVTNADAVNKSLATYVAYCFAAIPGYSAFGSYTGNNAADGTFVYLGFRPSFLMIKSTSGSTEWVMVDNTRPSTTPGVRNFNLVDTSLYANREYSEATIGTVNDIDLLSNGFKLRNNTGFVNASQTYIYMAFAESPFKIALAR